LMFDEGELIASRGAPVSFDDVACIYFVSKQ